MDPETHDPWLEVGADASTPEAIEALFDAAEAALASRGLRPSDVVRTRLIAATRAARDAASVVRFRRFTGPTRCATSSYIDPRAFAGPDGVRLGLLALAGAGDAKVAVEYEPRQPPCRYVATGRRVFLSGVTSRTATLESQLAEIGPRVAATLALAGARPVAATAYVHREVPDAALAGLGARLGLDDLPITIARCEGYSAPGKLIEVEVDAEAAG